MCEIVTDTPCPVFQCETGEVHFVQVAIAATSAHQPLVVGVECTAFGQWRQVALETCWRHKNLHRHRSFVRLIRSQVVATADYDRWK